MTAQTARQAATAHLQEASVAINTMFDRQDDVTATLTQIAESAATEHNVFTRTQAVLDQTERLTDQIAALQTAALAATEHRSKRDLARDLSASPSVVFPARTSSTDTAVEATAVAN